MIGCEDRNGLDCVGWDVKLYFSSILQMLIVIIVVVVVVVVVIYCIFMRREVPRNEKLIQIYTVLESVCSLRRFRSVQYCADLSRYFHLSVVSADPSCDPGWLMECGHVAH